jgi:hypothetical protein
MIHDEICTYEVAKLAKEKGFDGNSRHVYNNDRRLLGVKGVRCWHKVECAAPTQSLLQRWLREEKGYYVYPLFDNVQLMWDWVCREKTGDKWIPLVGLEFHLFPTYELALEDALKSALEILV